MQKPIVKQLPAGFCHNLPAIKANSTILDSKVMGRLFYLIYESLGWLITPFFPLYFKYRAQKGKEACERLDERYGKCDLQIHGKDLVWIHAASVGETNAILLLAKHLIDDGAIVLLTTGTVTSAQVVRERSMPGLIHRYFAHDVPLYRNRFLNGWQPKIALFTESEIWPGYIRELGKRNIPTFVVNARMSEKSFKTWKRTGPIGTSIFGQIDNILARSETDAERYSQLGAKNVAGVGDLKFGSEPLDVDQAQLLIMRGSVHKRPVFVAASLHPGEDELVLSAFEKARGTIKDLLLIMIPRHPERGSDMAQLAKSNGNGVGLRSAKDRITDEIQVFIADTLGELGLFYRLAPMAFIGGSLVAKGGQNPLEPIKLGVLPITGPHMDNFAQACLNILDPVSARIPISDPEELSSTLIDCINDLESTKQRAQRGQQELKKQEDALLKILNKIVPLLSRSARG